MKKITRITESDITRLVKKVLKEQSVNNNSEQQMIDSWNKIIKPKLKENGWSEGHGKYRMVKKHPYDEWFIHCVCIPKSGKDSWFAVYRVEKEFDVPTINQSVDFRPPKCGSIEECAKRALNTALKTAADI